MRRAIGTGATGLVPEGRALSAAISGRRQAPKPWLRMRSGAMPLAIAVCVAASAN
jgi:hypothetical protein